MARMHTHISLYLRDASFLLKKQDFPASYTLKFMKESSSGNDDKHSDCVEIELSPTAFEALLNQGRALVPAAQATLTSSQECASWREAAWPLYRLDDKEWQLLLREVTSDALIHVLWLMKDVELARKVLRNFSGRAAACLTEDLIRHFAGKNPDEAPASQAQAAYGCLQEILNVLARLQAEGQIAQWS